MFLLCFKKICRKFWSLRKDDTGFVMLYTMAIFLFLFVVCGSVFSVGEVIWQKMRLQNACDEAAYSAAVVEADGLARMAIVNQALAWNYVQMSNKQMDYITYKWLKLTKKRYEEDRRDAKRYHWRTVFVPNRLLCIPMLMIDSLWALAAIRDGLALNDSVSSDPMVPNDAAPFKWDACKHWEHADPGNGWWCGLGMESDSADHILLNKKTRISYKELSKICDNITDDNLKLLGASIDADKTTIETLNAMLGVIARNMQKSMNDTAQFVLTKLLGGNALDAYRQEDFLVRITVPQCVDPYQTESGSVNGENVLLAQTIFSPAYNTEPFERMVLDGISTSRARKDLKAHFGLSEANGLDQWFVRGGGEYSSNRKDYALYAPAENAHLLTSPSQGNLKNAGGVTLLKTQRTEGAPGIQRAYKDANINETKSDVLSALAIDRGNHVLHLFEPDLGESKDQSDVSNPGSDGSSTALVPSFEGFSFSNVLSWFGLSGSQLFLEGLATVVEPVVTNLFQQLLNEIRNRILDQVNSLADIMPSCGNQPRNNPAMCQEVGASIALVSEYRWASAKWFCTADYNLQSCLLWDWPYPEWVKWVFRTASTASVLISPSALNMYIDPKEKHYSVPKWYCGTPAWQVPFRNIPPLTSQSTNGHGYFQDTLDFGSSLKPFKSHERSEYCSCAVSPDGSFSTSADAPSAALRGHARIYGDDLQIWDNRYVGARIKPWLVNNSYFSGEGSIVVAVGRRQRNPFGFLFEQAGNAVASLGRKNLFYPFDPGCSGNRIWAFAAARAGVKRIRVQGTEKNKRLYQVVYDDEKDPKNHRLKNAQIFSQETGKSQSLNNVDVSDKQLRDQIISGCDCGTNLTRTWNLCETDWDATLLPVAYAASGASFRSGDRLDGKGWRWGTAKRNLLVPQYGEWIRFQLTNGGNVTSQPLSADELQEQMQSKLSTDDPVVKHSVLITDKVL